MHRLVVLFFVIVSCFLLTNSVFSQNYVDFHTRWALLVGVANYQPETGILPLQYPVSDVESLKRVLEESGGFDNIITLKDTSATYTEIHRTFQSLIGRIGPDDFFLFYFTGRGTRLKDDLFIDELDGFDECLLPYDAGGATGDNFLRDDEVGQFLQRIEAKNTVVVIDAAYVGGGAQDKGFAAVKEAVDAEKRYDGFTRGAHGGDYLPPGAVVLEACAPDSAVEDGQFAAALIEGLVGGADEDGDGIISLSHLFVFLRSTLRSQSPQISDEAAANKLSLVQPLLEVVSRPAGAKVIVDGDTLGVTPGQFMVTKGIHAFDVQKSAYEVYPSIDPVVEITGAGKWRRDVRLRPLTNSFTVKVMDSAGRPLRSMDLLLNGDIVGKTNIQGEVVVKKRLGPDSLRTVTLTQIGVTLDRQQFKVRLLKDNQYLVEAIVKSRPISVTVVDSDENPLSGVKLRANGVMVGETESLGHVEFDERLIGGRRNLSNLKLQVEKYGGKYEIAPQNIRQIGEAKILASLGIRPAQIEIRACVGTLDLGANVVFEAELYLGSPSDEDNRCGKYFPLNVETVLPGEYTLAVKIADDIKIRAILAAPGEKISECIQVDSVRAWKKVLQALREEPQSPELSRSAEELARVLGRPDLAGWLRRERGE